jgi:Na+/pantothenate symporter
MKTSEQFAKIGFLGVAFIAACVTLDKVFPRFEIEALTPLLAVAVLFAILGMIFSLMAWASGD